ncbi:MAG: hypothetical protein BV457_00260 [Thermoplasmata archaeon M9B1D]|nr:MAG: hypothetical protein BV457_00260 [Thermoplasmata archaeon M9B1D]
MANSNPELHIENLKPFNKRTAEEIQRITSMGAKASHKVQKENKRFRKIIEIIGQLEFKNKEIKENLKNEVGDIPEEISMDTALILGQYAKAISGNSKNATFIRDTKGEKPTEKIEQINANLEIKDEKIIDNVMSKIKEI